MLLDIEFILPGGLIKYMSFDKRTGEPLGIDSKVMVYAGQNTVMDEDFNYSICIAAPPKYTDRNYELLLRVIEHELLHSALHELGEEDFVRTVLALYFRKSLDKAAFTKELARSFERHDGKIGYDT